MGIRDERSVVETELDLAPILTMEGEYNLTVTAVNSIGKGPASSPVMYMYQLNNDQRKVVCVSC